MTTCTEITDYAGDRVYKPTKNPNTGHYEDQTAQQVRRNYALGFKCPCKAYINEFCNGKSKVTMYDVPPTKTSYFISTHIHSSFHKKWINALNTRIQSLETRTPQELIERIEELEREKRNDKVEFRKMLQEKEEEFKRDILRYQEMQAKDAEIIKILKARTGVAVENLIDL